MKKHENGFTLVELLVVIGILGILAAALFPAITGAMMRATMTAVQSKGRNIYMAITSANTDRAALSLANVWPRTKKVEGENSSDDISTKSYTSSTDYFWDLFDGDNVGGEDHQPVADDFNLSMLSGAGVNANPGTQKLTDQYNMWSIAANVRDEIDDIVPILVTRNFPCDQLYKKIDGKPDTTRIKASEIGKEYATPFGNKGFVIIRKGGGTLSMKTRDARPSVIYQGQSFDATTESTEIDPFCYLDPKKKVDPKQ